MRRYVTHSCLVLFISVSCAAQQPDFYLGFDQILDNREYYTQLGVHQTIFGARINPGVSFSFDSVHSIHAGVNYMYEYGGTLLGVNPQIDLYYSYQTEEVQLFVGSFPRREILDYPLFVMTDSLSYYRPNMEGALVGYSWDWGSARGWIDWTGRATLDTRESILAGFDARFWVGDFYLKAITTTYHLSHSKSVGIQELIRDDGSILALAGLNLSDRLPLDLVNIESGLATTYKKQRPGGYEFFNGWLSILDLKKSIFGFKGTYYIGGSSPLLFGEPLYSSGNYGRTDLFIEPFKNPRISSKIGWSLHFLPYHGVYQSQQLLIHISL